MAIEKMVIQNAPEQVIEVAVLTDSGNHRSPVTKWAYERVVILAGWNPADKNMLMKAWYRIDRYPTKSFCSGLIWTGNDLGWMDQGSMDQRDFWSWMPGWDRYHNERAHRAGMTLVRDLVVVMHDIALESAWVQELARPVPWKDDPRKMDHP